MSPDQIPDLSLGAAVLVIFVICVVLVLLRGMARVLAGTLILAVSGWIGLEAWHLAPAISHQLFGKSLSLLLISLPILSFALTFWLLIRLIRFVLLPFDSLRSDDKPKTSLIAGLLVAVVPTGILFLIGASLLHHFGAIEELRSFATGPADKGTTVQRFLKSSKSSLEKCIPEGLLRRLDPQSDPDRVKAAMLVTRRSGKKYEPLIDPETGNPYPRAIVIDEPELRNLAREGRFGTLLRHPLIDQFLSDPRIRQFIRKTHF